MRILIARLLVVVTGVLIVALAILFAVIRNSSGQGGPPAQASTIARGRAVWAEQRCRACHSIEGEGNTRSRLDGVGGRLTEKEIRMWIVAPQQMNPAVAKRPYQLPDADLDALVAYLMSTKSR
jgi:mono/diheme cytochrome c family protein